MKMEQGNNLIRVKVTNHMAILRMIYYFGPIKRAEIAKRLELTLPTITTNVNHMIAEGIVREVSAQDSLNRGYGRKAHLLEIVPDARHFIGIEMTGARRSISIVDYCGREIYSYYDAQICADYDDNMEETCRILLRCLEQLHLTLQEIHGICFSLPGVVDREQGILKVHPRNQWADKNITADFRSKTGYEGAIIVENNTSVRALGAKLYQWEILKNVKSFTYLFVDLGIACPLIVNNSNFLGEVVGAGEVGHMVMEPEGLTCSCGNHGCLEAYSSDRAIINRCVEAMEQGLAVVLREVCAGSAVPTMPQILEAKRLGDKDVIAIVDRAIRMLATAVANIINFASSDIMLIECKLFKEPEDRSLLVETAKRSLCNKTYQGTDFVFIEPNHASGAKGAAVVAIHNDLE